jgi:hypothetical protein
VQFLLRPVLEQDYQYVTPIYSRHKYDGTITNNIVYNLTRALYGKRIRQPIGHRPPAAAMVFGSSR